MIKVTKYGYVFAIPTLFVLFLQWLIAVLWPIIQLLRYFSVGQVYMFVVL